MTGRTACADSAASKRMGGYKACVERSRRSVTVCERPESKRDPEPSKQLTALLKHLFAIRLTPEGRHYTLTEVSKATGLSVPYLSILLKGGISAIPFQRVVVLARFFEVPLDYFSQEGPPAEILEEQVFEALAQPLCRELLLRSGKISTAQRALVLQILEHFEPCGCSRPLPAPHAHPTSECSPATGDARARLPVLHPPGDPP